MRIAIIGFNNVEKNEIYSFVSKKLKRLIFMDMFENDIEEAEYCVDIRIYDLIFINYKPENRKRYMNIFGSVSRKYENDVKIYFIEQKINSDLQSYLKETLKIYKNVSAEVIQPFYDRNKLLGFIAEKTETKFLNNSVENISINYDLKEINILTKSGEISFKIKTEIDYQVLLYFIRHYGEVININCILSAIAEEPEYYTNSSIETAISSIRDIFNKLIQINPITAFKKIGYRFQI